MCVYIYIYIYVNVINEIEKVKYSLQSFAPLASSEHHTFQPFCGFF